MFHYTALLKMLQGSPFSQDTKSFKMVFSIFSSLVPFTSTGSYFRTFSSTTFKDRNGVYFAH